jgi:hypothetical protein
MSRRHKDYSRRQHKQEAHPSTSVAMIRYPPTEITLNVTDIDLALQRIDKEKQTARQQSSALRSRQPRLLSQNHDFVSTIEAQARIMGTDLKAAHQSALEHSMYRMSLDQGDPQKPTALKRPQYEVRELSNQGVSGICVTMIDER